MKDLYIWKKCGSFELSIHQKNPEKNVLRFLEKY